MKFKVWLCYYCYYTRNLSDKQDKLQFQISSLEGYSDDSGNRLST